MIENEYCEELEERDLSFWRRRLRHWNLISDGLARADRRRVIFVRALRKLSNRVSIYQRKEGIVVDVCLSFS